MRIERLSRSPYDPSEDRVYWRVNVEGLDIHLYVTGTDAARVPVDDEEGWIAREVRERLTLYGDVDTLYALSPIQMLLHDES